MRYQGLEPVLPSRGPSSPVLSLVAGQGGEGGRGTGGFGVRSPVWAEPQTAPSSGLERGMSRNSTLTLNPTPPTNSCFLWQLIALPLPARGGQGGWLQQHLEAVGPGEPL